MRLSRVPLLALPLVAAMALVACRAAVTQLPNTAAALSYMPEGCDYTVTIPPGMEDSYYPATAPLATTAPIHVHASFASDPSTSFAVNWAYAPEGTPGSGHLCPSGTPVTKSSASGPPSPSDFCTDVTALMTQVIYGTSESAVTAATGTGSAGVTVQLGHTARYSSIDTDGNAVDARIHEAHVCGLTPATTYYYKVGNPGFFSKTYSLITAPAKGATSEFRFGVAGDSRDTPSTWATAEQDMQAEGDIFQIFSGDLINLPPDNQYEYNQFFEATFNASGTNVPASDVMAEVPIMPTSGNHDAMSINYMEQFAIPQNLANEESPAQGGKEWYSFNYGNVHFVALYDSTSTEVISGQEATWLDTDLKAVNRTVTPWVIVFHHQPIYSCDNNHGSDTDLDPWAQIFTSDNVDIVFNGHVHDYQRSYLLQYGSTGPTNITSGSSTNLISTPGATLYIVSGAAGVATYGCDAPSTCLYNYICDQSQNYTTVDVNGNTINVKVTSLDQSGVQLDAFSITKPG